MAPEQMGSTIASLQPLRIEGLVKRFGKLTAVDGITLDLNRGECLGLLGPNGAGKSTLIRSIVGRVIPDAGSVSVFGDPADSVGARMALGWVPQDLALYPRLTCRENLEAFGQYHGLRRAALRTAMAVRFDGPNYPHVVSKLGENRSKKGFADKSSPGLRARWSVEEGITV